MRLSLLTVLILCFFLSLPLTAQNWTAEEQEVLDQIKKGWTFWEKAVQAKDLNLWIDNMQPADDWSGWWTSDGGLWTHEKEERLFDKWVENVNDYYWEGLQPLSIKVYDDFALAYFYATYNIEDKTGKVTRYEDKRLEVYRKIDGIWRWTGAMVAGNQIGDFVELEQ